MCYCDFHQYREIEIIIYISVCGVYPPLFMKKNKIIYLVDHWLDNIMLVKLGIGGFLTHTYYQDAIRIQT